MTEGGGIGAGAADGIDSGPTGGLVGTGADIEFGSMVAEFAASSAGPGAGMGRKRSARAAERASSSGESLCFAQLKTVNRSSSALDTAGENASPTKANAPSDTTSEPALLKIPGLNEVFRPEIYHFFKNYSNTEDWVRWIRANSALQKSL